MKNKRDKKLQRLCVNAVIGALYAVLTILTAPIAYGPIQFRLSEAMVVLCAFMPRLGVGITVGCLLANLFSTVTALDIIVGTLATALACLLTARCKKAWLAILPNIIINTVMIGGMLAWVLMPKDFLLGFAINGAQVALGEITVMVFLGIPLFAFAKRTRFLEKLL